MFISECRVGYLHPKDYIKGVENTFLNYSPVHDVQLTKNEPVKILCNYEGKQSNSFL